MNHEEAKKRLPDYLESDLPMDVREEVDAHLDVCVECSQEVLEMEQTVRLLRALPEPETPPMIAANVMRKIRAGETKPSVWARLTGGFRSIFEPSFMLPASAIAAAALVVVIQQNPDGIPTLNLSDPFAAVSPNQPQPQQDLMATAPGLGSLERLTLAGARPREDRVGAGNVGSAGNTENVGTAGRGPVSPQSGSGLVASAPIQVDRPLSYQPTRRSPTRVPMSSISGTASGTANGLSMGTSSYGAREASVAMRNQNGLAQTVSAPIASGSLAQLQANSFAPVPSSARGGARSQADRLSAGGEDPRDAWLAHGLERPADFARFLANKSLAEQELWVARLADRAASRGLLAELVTALDGAGDPTAQALAADFLAEIKLTDDAGR